MVTVAKKWFYSFIVLYFSSLIILCSPSLGQDHLSRESTKPVLVSVSENLDRLVEEEDTDGDKKITIDDTPVIRAGRGDRRFWLISTDGKRYEVVGIYYLSNLLKELKLAQDEGYTIARIYPQRIFESPVRRISRSIREIYWDGLTRRIDEDNLS